jgi:hypothetical protein
MKNILSKTQVDEVLDSMKFGPDTRSEQLDVSSLLALTEGIRAVAPSWHL